MFSIFIAAVLNRSATHKIYGPPYQLREFLLHICPFQECRTRVVMQCRKQINVTVRIKVIAQSRAEQLKSRDSSLFAEVAESFAIEF